jgi:type II secretory pathway pseudopilin PulG
MMWAEYVLVAVAVLAVLAVVLAYWAGRVDRLNRQVDATRTSLDHQLTARATAALDLAHSGALDPASSIAVAEASRACLANMSDDGGSLPSDGTLESELSQAITVALGDADFVQQALGGPTGPLLEPLRRAWYRAMLARRFYNEAVLRARRLRGVWLVRVFRLAGHAPMPQTFEMEDNWPASLGESAA